MNAEDYIGQYVFIYNYDGMKTCHHVCKVVGRLSYSSEYFVVEDVIKLSANKICFKKNDKLRPWEIKIIPPEEYMAILNTYKKHEQMRSRIKKIFKDYREKKG